MKGSLFLALVLVLLSTLRAQAECDPPTFDKFPAEWPEATLPAGVDARAKLQNLIQQTKAYVTSKEIPAERQGDFKRVADFIDGKLAELRTKKVAEVELGFLQPRVCGARIENGLPVSECEWEVLAEPSIKVPLPNAQDHWKCEVQTKFAAYVRSGHEQLAVFAAELNARIADALVKYDQAWTQLINNGHSQYPWEVALNGAWINHKSWGPNQNFAVLLHPALGAGVANVDNKNGQAAAAAILAVEAAGYLRYFANHKQYVGGGLTATMNNLQGRQIGLGVVLHASGFSLGVSRDFWGEHEDEVAVFWLIDVGRAIDDNLLAKKIPDLIKKRRLSPAILEAPDLE